MQQASPRELAEVALFWREGCPHCRKEQAFLRELRTEYPSLRIRELNVEEKDGKAFFDALTDRFELPKVTPITVIGRRTLVGFESDETTGSEIRSLLLSEPAGLSLEDLLLGGRQTQEGGSAACSIKPRGAPCEAGETGKPGYRYISIPLIGTVDVHSLTLPALSLVLGLVDGFNPCAMWVLVAFLTALAQVGSRRKMIQFAGVLILAQGIMYAVILNSWLLAFDFIKADRIVTPVIGLLAIGGGIFFLWEFIRFRAACRITSMEQRARTSVRLGALSRLEFSLPVVLGIIAIALSVNVIEFACSIGIPQAYTKILNINAVTLFERQALISLYVLAYMLDDFLVFGLAIWSFEKIGLSTRYVRASNLIGGVLLIMLGSLLVFKPEFLRF